MTDVLESREFYELCQQYRHSPMGAQEFELLKAWIRLNADVEPRLAHAFYEEDRGLVYAEKLPSFPDRLPEMNASDRARINAILAQRLAQVLGWGRAQA